jgi:hypothetical protein
MSEMEKFKQMFLAEIEALVKVNDALEERVKALENQSNWKHYSHIGSWAASPLQTSDESFT